MSDSEMTNQVHWGRRRFELNSEETTHISLAGPRDLWSLNEAYISVNFHSSGSSDLLGCDHESVPSATVKVHLDILNPLRVPFQVSTSLRPKSKSFALCFDTGIVMMVWQRPCEAELERPKQTTENLCSDISFDVCPLAPIESPPFFSLCEDRLFYSFFKALPVASDSRLLFRQPVCIILITFATSMSHLPTSLTPTLTPCFFFLPFLHPLRGRLFPSTLTPFDDLAYSLLDLATCAGSVQHLIQERGTKRR